MAQLAAQQRDQVEVKLFVGRLPRTLDEEAVRPLFEEFGQVVEVVIIRDKATQSHKGSAFVRMASLTQADAAIRGLNSVKVLDPQLGAMQVRYAVGEAEKLGLVDDNGLPGSDQAKLFVGSLPRQMNEEQMRELFGQFGSIDEVFIMKDPSTGDAKGCAFIKFSFKEQAIAAIKTLNANVTVPGASRPIEVRFAEAKRPLAASHVSGHAAQQAMAAASFASSAAPKTVANKNLNPRLCGPWKEYFTNEGKAYYHQDEQKRTQWDRPLEFDQCAFRQAGPGGPLGANLLVENLPRVWTEGDLHSEFTAFGKLVSSVLPMDRVTGTPKGYGLISFESVNAAALALHSRNGWAVHGCRLRVTPRQGENEAIAAELHNLQLTAPERSAFAR